MPPIGLLLLPLPSVSLVSVIWILGSLTALCRCFGTHRVLKWPVFVLLGFLIAVDLLVYIPVRLLIDLFTIPEERAIAEAKEYAEWHAAAEQENGIIVH